MKKVLLSTGIIVIFAIYAIHQHVEGEIASQAVVAKKTGAPISTGTLFQVSAPVATQTPQPPQPPQMGMPTAMPMMSGYKDGTYVGDVADAFYGNVQVQVVISGGKITNVRFLQYPNDRTTSQMINAQAMPLLTQEAIQAQSAQIDGVSGATQTTRAFIESLSVALQKAS
jgi:uncharacterized protein with FMN-binding domain